MTASHSSRVWADANDALATKTDAQIRASTLATSPVIFELP